MYWHIYLRNGTVYLPTTGKMGKGFYRDVEPVAAVSIANIQSLREALAAMITRGNPTVPMQRRHEWSSPVVLKHAGVKSWSTFERGMSIWGLEQKNGVFAIIGKRKQPNGTRIDDSERTITFPLGATVDNVINRMIAILQDAVRST
jgi:hypothetical protein